MIVDGEWRYASDFTCIVEEDGVICGDPVRNLKRMYCQKHYARWQRNGHPYVSRNCEAKKRKEARRRTKELRLEAEGKSKICICAHSLGEHSLNDNCTIIGCKCWEFNSANADLFHKTMFKFESLGFYYPLNDTAVCTFCSERIRIGSWIDPIAIRRIREHLRMKHVVRPFRRAG